jgi:two-component system OmpR family response regulator
LRSGLAKQSMAIIAEIGTSGPAGPDLVRYARSQGLNQPLVLLCAHGGWRERVDNLDAGADDCMFKPVRAEEVAARLRVILRRCAGSAKDRLVAGGLSLDLKARTAEQDGQVLALTRHEFRLLRALMLQVGQVLSHSALHDQLYEHDRARTHNAVEVHIARLRRKLEQSTIRSVRGVGYMLLAETSVNYAR